MVKVRQLMAAVPVMCTFGPIEMILGFNTPYHLIALIAALITGTGIMIIFANVMTLIDPGAATANLRGAPRAPLVLALIAILIVGGIGAALIYIKHPLP